MIADSGAYSYGMAHCDVLDIQREPTPSFLPLLSASGPRTVVLTLIAGTYTAIVSTFDPGVTSPYTLNVESALPVNIEPIPAEGAGLYSRIVQSRW